MLSFKKARNSQYLERKGDFVIVRDIDYSKIISIEPGKRSGKPIIRGTRMTVTDVLEYLAGGMTEEQILAGFACGCEEGGNVSA